MKETQQNGCACEMCANKALFSLQNVLGVFFKVKFRLSVQVFKLNILVQLIDSEISLLQALCI